LAKRDKDAFATPNHMSTKTAPRRQSATQVIYEYVFVTTAPATSPALPVIAFE
jgi:hypothetical protein